MSNIDYPIVLSTFICIFTRRSQFDIDPSTIICQALDALQINSVPCQDDAEMEQLNTRVFACECILKGPFPLSSDQQRVYKDRLNHLASLHPKSYTINDYPKAIEFWNMVDRMRDDFLSWDSNNNIQYYIDGPECIVCSFNPCVPFCFHVIY